MKIEVSLSPAFYESRKIQTRHTTVVIDLLRATTAICAAFKSGCEVVVPVADVGALAGYRRQGYCLAAERDGKKVGDAEYGNSPTEYFNSDLAGIRLAYSTTNGTVALLKAAEAELTLVGSMVNISALCRRLRSDGRDVVMLCAGWKNDFCIEDTLVAGAAIEALSDCSEPYGDAALAALALWRAEKADVLAFCSGCSHVQRLMGLGAERDIRFAFQPDTCPVVPMLKDGYLVV